MSADQDEVASEKPAVESRRRRTLVRLLVVSALGAAALLTALAGISGRQKSYAKLREVAEARAIPNVNAAPASSRNNVVALDLPGRLEAYSRAALFARVNGYLASWKADIGAAVKAGDLLAEIAAPDLDQQLLQAQSDLANAQAAAKLAEVTNERFSALLPNKTISRQTADEKAADLAVKKAQAKSAEANVARLKSMTEYKRIVAPFDGTVTARNTDIGALINAGSSTPGTELFVVSDTRKLRLYVNVPQAYAPLIKIGALARLTLPERPGEAFAAKVEALAGAVDVASGTMRTQLTLDNRDGRLLPGAFANVHFDVAGATDVLSIPASALVFDKGGLRVAVVDTDGRVLLKPVTIQRDLGKTIEIGTGLTRDDVIIESPPDGLIDGDRVNVRPRAAEK